MIELWFRNDGPVNPPALICAADDYDAKGKFFPEVAIDQETVVFGGQFSSPRRAAEALRETAALGYGQSIVLGAGVSEMSL
jgi:hypothetical protein